MGFRGFTAKDLANLFSEFVHYVQILIFKYKCSQSRFFFSKKAISVWLLPAFLLALLEIAVSWSMEGDSAGVEDGEDIKYIIFNCSVFPEQYVQVHWIALSRILE